MYTQAVLSDLARVKAVFQLRAIETVLRGEPVRLRVVAGPDYFEQRAAIARETPAIARVDHDMRKMLGEG